MIYFKATVLVLFLMISAHRSRSVRIIALDYRYCTLVAWPIADMIK